MIVDPLKRSIEAGKGLLINEGNRFLTVLESLGSPLLLFDHHGRLSYANQAAAPVLGLGNGKNRTWSRRGLAAAQTPGWLQGLVNRARRSCSPIEHELAGSETGSQRTYSVHLDPVVDDNGQLQGVVAVLHDITALRRTEQELRERTRQLEQLSHTDALTGLYNRRGLLAAAETHLELARRSGRPLSVLYGDVDNLKMINDSHGHLVGDAALIALASALQLSFRASDTTARVGGDEFVVVLPDWAAPVDEVLLQRTRTTISNELRRSGIAIALGISLGSARYDPERHQSFEQLLADADAAMYQEKHRKQSTAHHRSRREADQGLVNGQLAEPEQAQL